jgi:hypothetical protein
MHGPLNVKLDEISSYIKLKILLKKIENPF